MSREIPCHECGGPLKCTCCGSIAVYRERLYSDAQIRRAILECLPAIKTAIMAAVHGSHKRKELQLGRLMSQGVGVRDGKMLRRADDA